MTERTGRRIVGHTSLLLLHHSLAPQTAGSTVGTPHHLQLGQRQLQPQVPQLLLLEQHTAVRKALLSTGVNATTTTGSLGPSTGAAVARGGLLDARRPDL